jgi:transposase-like protein
MYSYEDRIEAVKLYIKLGKRVRPTIRQRGYPTKNALKGWYREYEKQLDLPVGYAGREPKYSQAQKEAAVDHRRLGRAPARMGQASGEELPRLHPARDPAQRPGYRCTDRAGHPRQVRRGQPAGRFSGVATSANRGDETRLRRCLPLRGRRRHGGDARADARRRLLGLARPAENNLDYLEVVHVFI